MLASQKHKGVDEQQQQNDPHNHFAASSLCNFQTWLKLNQNHKNVTAPRQKQSSSRSPKKQEVPSVIVLSQNDQTVHFHSYKKFNSYQFRFEKVFTINETNFSIAKNIDLYDELVVNNKDFCLLTIGGVKSGIESLCQNQYKEGLFSLMLCSLFDHIESISQRKVQKISESQFISNIKLSLKFIVISNQKLYDLQSPKNVVVLKDNNSRYNVTGCLIFHPSSVYDITLKLQQVSKNRRLIYPQSILVIGGEVSFDKPHVFGEIVSMTRNFTLIEWEKSLAKNQTNPKNANNNLSLLNLNMCLYELYKSSCQSEQEFRKKSRKMWAIFRNNSITKILKSYIKNSRRVIVMGCVASEEDEEEIYQTLMICKNAAKIKWNGRTQSEDNNNSMFLTQPKKKVDLLNVPGYVTQPVSLQKIEKRNDKVDLTRLKEQLKKILREKEMSQEKQKEKQVKELIKMQNRKKVQLKNMRYQKQQLRFNEEIKQVRHTRVHSIQPGNLPTLSKHTIQHSRQSSICEKKVQNIEPKQQNLQKEVEQIRDKLIRNLKESKNLSLNHSFLKQQIHRQQNDVIEYVAHKQKMINYLKGEMRELKKQYRKNVKNQVFINPVVRDKQPWKTIEPKVSPLQKSKEKIEQRQENGLRNNTQESSVRKGRKQRVMTDHIGEPKQNFLKMSNKKSYLFQKRRLELKQKLRKDRQKMDNYYEQAAQKFQQYSRVKQ